MGQFMLRMRLPDAAGTLPPGLEGLGAGAVFAINPTTGNRTVVSDFFNTSQGIMAIFPDTRCSSFFCLTFVGSCES